MKEKYNKIVLTLVILLYTLVIYFSPISCVILELTGFECLGCGMSRALFSALKLDFKSAFSYHRMFWAVPVLYICFWKDGRLFKNKTLNILFYSFIFIGFLLNWIF